MRAETQTVGHYKSLQESYISKIRPKKHDELYEPVFLRLLYGLKQSESTENMAQLVLIITLPTLSVIVELVVKSLYNSDNNFLIHLRK